MLLILVLCVTNTSEVTHSNYYLSTYQVSNNLSAIYSEMIFEHGFVHCDPHPGNVLVKKTPNHNAQIVLLDHGLYTVSNLVLGYYLMSILICCVSSIICSYWLVLNYLFSVLDSYWLDRNCVMFKTTLFGSLYI